MSSHNCPNYLREELQKLALLIRSYDCDPVIAMQEVVTSMDNNLNTVIVHIDRYDGTTNGRLMACKVVYDDAKKYGDVKQLYANHNAQTLTIDVKYRFDTAQNLERYKSYIDTDKPKFNTAFPYQHEFIIHVSL